MKWRYYFIILVVFILVVLGLLMIGTYAKDSLNYDSREIDTLEDVSDFLVECRQKFGLDCGSLLVRKLDAHFTRRSS